MENNIFISSVSNASIEKKMSLVQCYLHNEDPFTAVDRGFSHLQLWLTKQDSNEVLLQVNAFE